MLFRGSDGKHYEKRIDAKGHESEPVCIEDEIPFEIPDSWEWMRLGSYLDIRDGTHDTPRYVSEGFMLVTSKNLTGEGKLDLTNVKFISEDDHKKIQARSKVDPGDILFAMIGSIGNPVLVTGNTDFSIKNMALFKRICELNDMRYVLAFLDSMQETLDKMASGGVQKFISLKFFRNLLVPIPPLNEQTKIVEKLGELRPLSLEFDALETAREKLDSELPDKLRKSILQMAVQGKLVPQDPNDEPASVLLDHIRKQRRQLITEGKIKAPKGGESVIYRGSDGGYYEKRVSTKGQEPEPICIDDEIPFEIPESWEWVRLACICSHIVDGDHNPPKNSGRGVPILSAANIHNGSLHIDEAARWITESDYEKAAKRLRVSKGNVLMTIVGTIGRTAVVETKLPFALQRSVSVIAQLCLNPHYLAFVLESYSDYLQSISSGTAQKGVYLGTLNELLIPIAPIEEQQRIVNSLEIASSIITNQS